MKKTFDDLYKLSLYYVSKSHETKKNLSAIDDGENKITNQPENMNQTIDAEYKNVDMAKVEDQVVLESVAATYRLVYIKKLIRGSQLSFSLNEQQRKLYKEFTPQHSKSIDVLAQINMNLKYLSEEEQKLKTLIDKFEVAYKKELKINEIPE